MAHERRNSAECLVAVMRLWNLHHLACVAKSLVVMSQCQCIILGREKSVNVVKDELLRVGEHIVEGRHGRKAHRIPRAAQ
jgi:hypothetical protein